MNIETFINLYWKLNIKNLDLFKKKCIIYLLVDRKNNEIVYIGKTRSLFKGE